MTIIGIIIVATKPCAVRIHGIMEYSIDDLDEYDYINYLGEEGKE
ncbi:hypothetical protein GCM10010916_23580 [Paenibacillus abyssi]|uniref:Uncharacterized protein n=1 Tax=Paenibacillus abyssi TaxID=1340531 RepID=A0A917D1U9_9BACL|nr:hypothetical protein GCM10010916_23580 [Paenibacillus abyssi]